MTTRQLPVAY